MKSIEVKFNEALAAIDKAGKRKAFDEKLQAGMSIETRLNLAEEILKDVGVVRAKESAPIKKNNGAADNYSENNPFRPLEEFRESANSFSPGYVQQPTDVCAKGDRVMFDGLLKLGKITEAEHRKLTGAKPAGYAELNEHQRKEFDFARRIGISEADAFRVAKMNNLREVSR